jgi:hypothetical protein
MYEKFNNSLPGKVQYEKFGWSILFSFTVWFLQYPVQCTFAHIQKHFSSLFCVDDYDNFKRDIHRLFPYIIDTKHIAFALNRHEVSTIIT